MTNLTKKSGSIKPEQRKDSLTMETIPRSAKNENKKPRPFRHRKVTPKKNEGKSEWQMNREDFGRLRKKIKNKSYNGNSMGVMMNRKQSSSNSSIAPPVQVVQNVNQTLIVENLKTDPVEIDKSLLEDT